MAIRRRLLVWLLAVLVPLVAGPGAAPTAADPALPPGWQATTWEGITVGYPPGYTFHVADSTDAFEYGTLRARAEAWIEPCGPNAGECYSAITFQLFPASGLGPREWVARYQPARNVNRDFRDITAGGQRGIAFDSGDPCCQVADQVTYVLPTPGGEMLVVTGLARNGNLEQLVGLLGFAAAPSAKQCFAATGKCVQGRFLAYWQDHGGLAVNGYPLSDEFTQTLEDGKPYTVQYFERVRMEYHPENASPYDVELGQFGRRILAGVPIAPMSPASPQEGDTFFQQTQHNVSPQFLAYWNANGGLAQFGYPLTEPFPQQLEDGKTYTVQYFERARFEAHPENPPPYGVELGQFGRRILAASQSH